MKELTYKSSKKLLFSFQKNEIWQPGIGNLFFSEDNIKVTCSNYANAISFGKDEDGIWRVTIKDWDKVIMNSKEVFITISVYYSNVLKLTEEVKIKHPIRTISPSDFDISLSPEFEMWGKEGKVCSLNLHLKSEYKTWMYDNTSFTVGFGPLTRKGFSPLEHDLSKPFELKDGCSIDLKYVGYDQESPIKAFETRNVIFCINDINSSKTFGFNPRPYSYELEVTRKKEKYRFGDLDRILYQIELKRTDPLSPIAETIDFRLKQNKIFSVCEVETKKKWDISLKQGVSYDTLYIGIKDTISCVIDNGKYKLNKEIEIGGNEKQDKHYIRVTSGAKPDMELTLNNRAKIEDRKLLFYCGENGDCRLVVSNKIYEQITINNISAVLAFNKVLNVFSISGAIQQKIRPQENASYAVSIDTSKEVCDVLVVTVNTKETEQTTIKYDICIKNRPEALITIVPLDSEEEKPIVGEKYLKGYCLAKCEVGYDKQSPLDSKEIDLKKIKFDSDYCISDTDLKKSLIPKSDSVEVNLVFATEFLLKNDNRIGVRDGGQYVFLCNWEYCNQKGVLQIPVIMPKLYCIKLLSSWHNEIVFPKPNCNRVIKAFEFEFSNLSGKDANIRWDTNQKMFVELPFSFSESKTDNEIVIESGKRISCYLHVNMIDGIDKNTRNIDEKRIVYLQAALSSDNYPSIPILLNVTTDNGEKKNILPEVVLLPIEAMARGQVLFCANNKETLLRNDMQTRVSIQIQQEALDVEALLLGYLIVRNLEQIPYKNNGIDINAILSLKDNDIDILHPKTEIPHRIAILNGESEVSIPIYIDYKKWVQAGTDNKPVLRFEISPTNENIDETVKSNTFSFEAIMDMTRIFVDDVYALDLGTTGIVIAKELEDIAECVVLQDVDNPIEKDAEILSSHIMIKTKSSETETSKFTETEILLAPPKDEYYGGCGDNKRFRLVPSKFIIGREKIPFLSSFYNDESIPKNVKPFGVDDAEIDLSFVDNLQNVENNKKNNEENISKLISSLYKEIFRRMNKDIDKVKKLVVTYPNTYTIENLEAIKSIMIEKLGLKMNGQISFVPESDAVAAYYFDQKIMYDNGFFDEKGLPVLEENVIFYDMGAGTLDLSFVKFKKEEGDGITAMVMNKVGVPLAGNYLDSLVSRKNWDG